MLTKTDTAAGTIETLMLDIGRRARAAAGPLMLAGTERKYAALTGLADGLNRVARSPLSMAASGFIRAPEAMIIAVPAAVAIFPASSLVFMPPREISEAAAPAMASMAGVILSTTGKNSASGSRCGGAV